MKILDRYLIRQLFTPILYCTISLVFLILIADLFNNLDIFLKEKANYKIIGSYYLSLIPYAYTQIIPWAAWLGTLFLLVNLGFHNETIAMKAAGLKITTIIKPVFFLGFLIAIFTFLVGDRIVPKTYRYAEDLREVYIERRKEKTSGKTLKNVTFYSKNKQVYYFRTFSRYLGEVTGVIGLWLDQNELNTRRKMVAKKGNWINGSWTFSGITEYQMDSKGRILGEPKVMDRKAYPEADFTPQELADASSDSAFLTYRELSQSIKKLQENGVLVYTEKVDLHSRLASPWQALVMMIVCVPLLAKTTNRKLIALNVLYCVGVAFLFYVVSAIGIALGNAGRLFPFISAWLANAVFASGALFGLEKANH